MPLPSVLLKRYAVLFSLYASWMFLMLNTGDDETTPFSTQSRLLLRCLCHSLHALQT